MAFNVGFFAGKAILGSRDSVFDGAVQPANKNNAKSGKHSLLNIILPSSSFLIENVPLWFGVQQLNTIRQQFEKKFA
ncbi:hypothetical protein PROVALCAL_00227 [Providencia alcalifaciens DSM 30120]|uniref:Uncharacterized protein n=1 Tax=Providencia alcalifaciens DSM 30120 TaxID=520999 RepID=B6XA81_9GAMM|nr:hypothetical protein PROVALCAL_00227 [Providencia alcalifaciens DSM 30120]